MYRHAGLVQNDKGDGLFTSAAFKAVLPHLKG
jgi:hypothetical protein